MKNLKGYTLIELLMTIALTAIVISLSVFILTYYLRNYTFSFTQQQIVNEGQTTFMQLIRNIREIRTGENGSWPIIDAQDTSFTFYSDVTNDGRADRVRFYVENNQLKRGIIEPTLPPVTYPIINEKISVVADHIDTSLGPIFTYYNNNWPNDTINNPLPVDQRLYSTSFVNIKIYILIDSNDKSAPYEISSGVMLKNLKTNL